VLNENPVLRAIGASCAKLEDAMVLIGGGNPPQQLIAFKSRIFQTQIFESYA
jgi:hypothetical protein